VSTDRTVRAGAAETREAPSRLERRLLACGVIGPPLFVAAVLVESVVHPPGYDPLRRRARVPVLIGLFAIGMIGSGLFAADQIVSGVAAAAPYPPGTLVGPGRTLHGVLHDLFGIPVFLGLPVACCVIAYRLAAAGRRGWAAYSAGTAVGFLLGFVLTSMALAQPPLIPPVGGLLQRLTIIIGWTWLTALALHMLRQAPRVAPTAR
jgi:Protein of unknown function (DUF998)